MDKNSMGKVGCLMNTETLQAASVLCGICSKLLYSSLTEEDIAFFKEQSALLREEPFTTVAPDAAARIADTFDALESAEETDALYHELKQDYTFLFYQASVSHISPYESVWRTDDQTLFGPTTLEVRAAYKAAGFELATDQSQPDDHLGTELNFISQLFARAAEADEDAAAADIEAARAFLSDHTLVFASYFLADFKEAAHTDFYRAVGALVEQTLATVAELTGAKASADIYRMP